MTPLFQGYLTSFIVAALGSLLVLFAIRLLRNHVHAGNLLRIERILLVGISITALTAPLAGAWLDAFSPSAAPDLLASIPLQLDLLTVARLSAPPASSMMSLPAILAMLWLAGAVLVIGSLLRGVLHFRRIAVNGTAVKAEHLPVMIPSPVRVVTSAECKSVFVTGLFRPVIALPVGLLRDDEPAESSDILAAVLLHELAHVENHDAIWLPVCRLLLGLAWPVIPLWLLYQDLALQAELAADAKALAGTGRPERRRYATSLIEVMSRSGNLPAGMPTFTSQPYRSARMRIRNILRNNEITTTRLRRSLACSIAAAVVLPFAGIQLAAATGLAEIIFASPLAGGKLTSSYGERRNPITGEMAHHNGVDIKAPLGTPILAPAKGEVTFAGTKNSLYGVVVEIRHAGGFRTFYAHLQSTHLEVGDVVDEGMEIARVGNSGQSTGPHVHVELFKDGKRVDPMSYLPLRDKKSHNVAL